jgi:hypothetical protein
LDARAADAAGHRRHVVEVRRVAHRRHGDVEIAGELGVHVLLEQVDHGLTIHGGFAFCLRASNRRGQGHCGRRDEQKPQPFENGASLDHRSSGHQPRHATVGGLPSR